MTVSTEDLEKFVSGKYNWKSMLPKDQKDMAVELLERRQKDLQRIALEEYIGKLEDLAD